MTAGAMDVLGLWAVRGGSPHDGRQQQVENECVIVVSRGR